MRITIYDFEIFRLNHLLGTLTINEHGGKEYYQTWSQEAIKDFYYDCVDDTIFVSHNGFKYDQPIFQEIIKGRNPYSLSKQIVGDDFTARSYLKMMEFDCMKVRRNPFGLKLTELIAGRSIETSEVDFDIERELNKDEMILTEEYNRADLDQTLYNFERFYPQFELRINIGKTFNIGIKDSLKLTEAQLAARVLGAKQDPSLKYKIVKPIIWPTLQIKNQAVVDWYLKEEYMDHSIVTTVCGAEHTLGKGGIHSAVRKAYYDKVLYYDVSGYYNLVMLNLGLLPRTLPPEGKEKYRSMYIDQLKMKGIPEKANARKSFKTILLAVFGSMNNEYGDFYDPYHFYLVTLSGQLFIIDLLEKLEGLVEVVQSNTDGIMLHPYNWEDEAKIDAIVQEWEDRTGFNMEKGYLYKLWQRDVNCYFALDEKGKVDYKGEVINYITDDTAYGACKLFDSSNPPIIAKGIIDYLLYEITPEETVMKNRDKLINFQYPCKKGTYKSVSYDTIRLIKGKTKKVKEELVDSVPAKDLNRAFAAKIEYDENQNAVIHTLIKHGTRKDPNKTSKVANLPSSIFIYNKEILNAYEELKDKIDYQYYIDTIYEKILTFMP